MSNDDLLWLAGGILLLGAAGLATGVIAMPGSQPWADLPAWSTWAGTLESAEGQYGLPAGLLSAVAYQESGFNPSVIDGTQASSAGALGIMQLEPAYFTSVQVPVPFSAADTAAQIDQAAGYLAQLYQQFGDWPDALAAYNAGPGTVQNVQTGAASALPAETQAYVAAITANVPAAA